MKKYVIIVAEKETGKKRELVTQSPNEESAVKFAQEKGYLVVSIKEQKEPLGHDTKLVTCEHCGRGLETKCKYSGRQATCPYCRRHISIPGFAWESHGDDDVPVLWCPIISPKPDALQEETYKAIVSLHRLAYESNRSLSRIALCLGTMLFGMACMIILVFFVNR